MCYEICGIIPSMIIIAYLSNFVKSAVQESCPSTYRELGEVFWAPFFRKFGGVDSRAVHRYLILKTLSIILPLRKTKNEPLFRTWIFCCHCSIAITISISKYQNKKARTNHTKPDTAICAFEKVWYVRALWLNIPETAYERETSSL